MAGPELSVIIPTYNREEILLKTLAAYQRQSARSEILEVMVLDDGSTDGPAEAVREFARTAQVPVRYFRLTHRGLAAVRNHGIREARGRLILFGDDDIVPGPDLVAEHLAWHKKYPQPTVGVLGLVEWAPEVHPTPFMEWLAKDGVLFSYGKLKAGGEVRFPCCYFCNTSLKTDFLRENGVFDEDFKTYGFEDAELGYRLERRGLRLLYNPDAVGHHVKFMSFQDACKRARLVAAAWRVFETKQAGKFLAEAGFLHSRRLTSRVKRAIFRPMVPFFGLLRPLLDTRIALPRFAYGKIYHYFAELPAQREAKHVS